MGPLNGIRVIELKGIGPGPYAGMLLADLGAKVISVERARQPTGIGAPAAHDIHCRGKRSITLNLKTAAGIETALGLIDQADMLIEGFRPGVMEKLGLGPNVCHARNSKLIYGRMSGWGQEGPLSNTAGHDLNYIALTGALAAIGDKDKPIPPLNLVGDYAGGSLFLVMGMLAALHAATLTGKGDVVDAAIIDGSASLMSILHSLYSLKSWAPQRESNLLDGAAHFYQCYETADGKFVSIASIEPQFYALLIEKAELDESEFADQMNPLEWAAKSGKLAGVIKSKTREQWVEIMQGSDVCFAPVLDFTEAPMHPHHQARQTYIKINGVTQPAPAPRFNTHSLTTPNAPSKEGADTEAVLADFGFSEQEIRNLSEKGVLG